MKRRVVMVGFWVLAALSVVYLLVTDVVPSQAFGAPSLEGATCLQVVGTESDKTFSPSAEDAAEVGRLVANLQLVGPAAPLEHVAWPSDRTCAFQLRLRDGSTVWLATWNPAPYCYVLIDDQVYDCASSNVVDELQTLRLHMLMDQSAQAVGSLR